MKHELSPTHKKMINRLSRAEGQIRALKHALKQDDLDCQAFITQVKAARSALKGVSEEYILAHLSTCQALPSPEREKQMAEAIHLLASH